jgi:hypothetical protein
MRISATKALNALQDAGIIQEWTRVREYDDWREVHETTFKVDGDVDICNETYGRDSRMYVYAKDEKTAKETAKVLKSAGVERIGWDWCKDNKTRFEFPVTYFKGKRWWE